MKSPIALIDSKSASFDKKKIYKSQYENYLGAKIDFDDKE